MDTREKTKSEISDLCDQAGCSEKIRKIHYDQYVHRAWNPHPLQRFVNWWNSGGAIHTEKKTLRGWLGVTTTVAFNCEAVRESYREAKGVGLVENLNR